MVKVNFIMKTVEFIMGCIKMIRSMVKACIYSLMERKLKEIGLMVNKKVKVSSLIQTEKLKLDFGKMVSVKVGSKVAKIICLIFQSHTNSKRKRRQFPIQENYPDRWHRLSKIRKLPSRFKKCRILA